MYVCIQTFTSKGKMLTNFQPFITTKIIISYIFAIDQPELIINMLFMQ